MWLGTWARGLSEQEVAAVHVSRGGGADLSSLNDDFSGMALLQQHKRIFDFHGSQPHPHDGGVLGPAAASVARAGSRDGGDQAAACSRT